MQSLSKPDDKDLARKHLKWFLQAIGIALFIVVSVVIMIAVTYAQLSD